MPAVPQDDPPPSLRLYGVLWIAGYGALTGPTARQIVTRSIANDTTLLNRVVIVAALGSLWLGAPLTVIDARRARRSLTHRVLRYVHGIAAGLIVGSMLSLLDALPTTTELVTTQRTCVVLAVASGLSRAALTALEELVPGRERGRDDPGAHAIRWGGALALLLAPLAQLEATATPSFVAIAIWLSVALAWGLADAARAAFTTNTMASRTTRR